MKGTALLVQELRLGVPFPGIILSPVGKACVSCQDKELIAAKGLAVVDCSWNRLEDVPFGEPAQSLHRLMHLSLVSFAGPSRQRQCLLLSGHPHAPADRSATCEKQCITICRVQATLLTGLPWGQRCRAHQGARAAAAALAAGGQPRELRPPLQAVLRGGVCRRALHLRLAARGLQRALPLQVVGCFPIYPMSQWNCADTCNLNTGYLLQAI